MSEPQAPRGLIHPKILTLEEKRTRWENSLCTSSPFLASITHRILVAFLFGSRLKEIQLPRMQLADPAVGIMVYGEARAWKSHNLVKPLGDT